MDTNNSSKKVQKMTDYVNSSSSSSSHTSSAPRTRTTAPARTFTEIVQERALRTNPSSGGRRRRKKKKSRRFRRFVFFYSAALLLILIVGSIIFALFLNTLEKSQSYKTAEAVTEEFNSGSESLTEYLTENADSTNSLETDTEALIAAYVSAIGADENTFSYVENSNYTESAPSYDITLDGETIAQITLTTDGKRAFGLTKWAVSSINIADYITGTSEYDVLVPTGSAVTVNGIELDSSYMTAENEVPEVLANSVSYMAASPTYDTYHISGFINVPEVSVTDASGTALSVTASSSTYLAGVATSDEFIASVSDRVTAAIESWGTYFINKSYNLSSYMLSGTEWYAYIFGSDTVDPIYTAFYGSSRISSYTFTELSATNYIQYTDDCFTVDVSYDMELTFTEAGYSDDNQNLDATWVWVNADGTWYISDVIYAEEDTSAETEED